DGAHPASRIAVPGAAAAQAHAGIPARQRRGPTDGDAADAYDGLLSSSLPSGSPTMHGGFPGVHDRAGPDFPAPYAPVTYPPLSAAISRGDSGAGLSPGHPPHPPHARTASHQAAPRQLDDGSGQLQWPSVDSVLPYSSLANQAATIGNTLRSSASDISLPGEQQQPQQQAPGPVYQMLAMDTGASGSSGAAQLYPVSQPGLPPAGPASASLSAYAMGVGSPMVARGRGRRKPYNAGDYPDADSAMNFSPDTPPALTAGPVSASALLSLPAMRQTLSNNDAAVLGYGPDSERWSSASRRPSGLRVSTAQHQGFGGPVYSPAASVHTADQMPPATATEPGSARAGVYSYPEMAYAADTAAQPGWDQPDTMMDTSGGSDCDVADGSMPASLRSTSDGRRNAGSQASLRPEATPEGSPQYHEQAAIPASMAHMRWNPATGNSPLRMEIGGGGLAHIYGTLPRTQAAAGALHGQPPPAAADTQAMEQRPWPRISPQNNGGQTATTQQCSRSGGPDPQPSPAAAAATDYYMITSPGGPVGGEPAALRPGSSTLLPMVEVGQGARVPLASNMDEINAHSQEYLHRRRRRLTQTMHNRQRSGSAADTATRHSTSRLNAGMPMSSPGAMSHGSNRSMEDAVPYSSHLQPLPAGAYQAPAAAAPVAPYVGGPYVPLGTDYVFAEQAAMGQTRAQEQAQAEYMRRLRLEHERLRLAIEQQQQQQQAKLALAQEQEVARFRNYRPLMNLTVDIVETYRRCRPEFYYESTRRPRRVLTHPSEGVKNDGFDNENSDYILYVNDVIGDREGHQFLIMEMLGSGT
ncbi:dual specificity protein kinase yak1, partial [Coemansia spiralis]